MESLLADTREVGPLLAYSFPWATSVHFRPASPGILAPYCPRKALNSLSQSDQYNRGQRGALCRESGAAQCLGLDRRGRLPTRTDAPGPVEGTNHDYPDHSPNIRGSFPLQPARQLVLARTCIDVKTLAF